MQKEERESQKNNKEKNSGDKKITVKVITEGGQKTFTGEFVIKQKLKVLINKVVEELDLQDADKRTLSRSNGTKLQDYDKTFEELGIEDNETLRFILNVAPKPEEPKKFA